MSYKFGFIGCGNMGGALACAVAKSVDGKQIALCDTVKEKADEIASKTGGNVVDILTLAKESEFVVLGVKPQVIESAMSEVRDVIKSRKEVVVISMAAGVSISAIRKVLGESTKVIRIMPNTPVQVGEGLILYVNNAGESEEKEFLSAFSQAGCVVKVDESKIDACSALTGCGPAFAYIFIEALADGAVEIGLTRDQAVKYAAQTVLGSAKTVLEKGHPADLKDAVCSPGGTTIAGVHALEESGLRAGAMSAVTSAYKRTLELKK